MDLNDLPIPGALFRRSILSSPFLYWLASCLLYLFNVTQQYNRIRSPPLLAPHPQYHFTVVSLRRYDQCVAESWLAVGALLGCGMCVLLLSVAVLEAGPYITVTGSGSWRQEQEEQRQQDEQSEQPMHQQQQVQQQTAAVSSRPAAYRSGRSISSVDRHRGNWPCIAVLVVLFFFFYVLRHMATIKWPQYRHGNVWTVIR